VGHRRFGVPVMLKMGDMCHCDASGSLSASPSASPSSGEVVCARCASGFGPDQWQILVAGVTNGGEPNCLPPYCSNANRLWTLDNVVACFWKETISTLPATCTASNAFMECELSKSSSTAILVEFRIGGLLLASYFKSSGASDCFVSHTLTRVSMDFWCRTWPASIVVAPVV
jgi:hypothetical protein